MPVHPKRHSGDAAGVGGNRYLCISNPVQVNCPDLSYIVFLFGNGDKRRGRNSLPVKRQRIFLSDSRQEFSGRNVCFKEQLQLDITVYIPLYLQRSFRLTEPEWNIFTIDANPAGSCFGKEIDLKIPCCTQPD